MTSLDFSSRLIAWQRQHGRHHLPWQVRDAYRVWLSEIMLQQTQVATVLPYYSRFVERFPDVHALAAAELNEVLGYWSGLGYYSRARNLHRTAQQVVLEHGGHFPPDPELLQQLPGIGRSTAAAIAAFAFGVRAAILDGNVKRVLARHAGIDGYPGEARIMKQLWQEAQQRLPAADIEAYTQGLMDLGSQVCLRRRPLCAQCPLAVDCQAHLQGRQEQWPAPRPRKTLPQRSCRVIIVLDEERVLLQTRNLPGVWQGLSSLPEGEAERSGEDIARALGLQAQLVEDLPALEHVFSHYRLTLHPSVLRLQAVTGVQDGSLHWLSRRHLAQAALPAPVRRLLEQLPGQGIPAAPVV